MEQGDETIHIKASTEPAVSPVTSVWCHCLTNFLCLWRADFYDRLWQHMLYGKDEQSSEHTRPMVTDTYLHNAHPPNAVWGVVAIRIDRVNICSMESTPSTLPAAIALLLYAKEPSLCCLASQYRQHQVPFGTEDKPTHSVIHNQRQAVVRTHKLDLGERSSPKWIEIAICN
jgi:hypothetical protein